MRWRPRWCCGEPGWGPLVSSLSLVSQNTAEGRQMQEVFMIIKNYCAMPSESSSGGSDYITTYTYDAWDNMNQVSMPRPSGTQTRSFTYNGKLLQSATNPENGTVTYTYNSYNKVATKTDA